MRALAPGDALVYLETEDLSRMLEAVTENQAFREIARKPPPDFSALKGAQAAIVVTGFETSEKQLAQDAAILNFKPQFVLIADTHAWERTNLALVENQLSGFITKTYGDETRLEKSERSGAQIFVWTAAARRIYAAVAGSLIYVGNDEAALEKCLAARRGATANLLANENLARHRERGKDQKIAFGYIAPEGVRQLADYAGVALAAQAAEETAAKSFIAKTLPQMISETAREVSWTARRTNGGIEDRIHIKPDAQILDVWKETLVPPADNRARRAAEFLPADFASATRYDLNNPQIAWRSVLLALANNLDAPSSRIWLAVAEGLLAPYGIDDAETFLSQVEAEIITARLASGADESVAIIAVKNEAKVKSSLAKEFNFKEPPEKIGAANVWKSAESELAAAFVGAHLVLGSSRDVLKCLEARESNRSYANSPSYQSFASSNAVATTVGEDQSTAAQIARVLTDAAVANDSGERRFYTTETRVSADGIERRTVSDFGLIGMLIEQFASEK